MRILAICDERYAAATWKVVGEEAVMISSPPLFASDIEPGLLAGYDFVFVDLHAQPGSVYLYSGIRQDQAALKVDTVREADLGGAVVFAMMCYFPETPFLKAFLEAGAAAVIGGGEENFGTTRRLSGAQHLAKYLLQGLEVGRGLEWAFQSAKRRLMRKLSAWVLDPVETADTLRFRMWRPEVVSSQ